MNPDNERAGPCHYCDKIVLEGTGRSSTSNGAMWHKECVGSGRHRARNLRDGAASKKQSATVLAHKGKTGHTWILCLPPTVSRPTRSAGTLERLWLGHHRYGHH